MIRRQQLSVALVLAVAWLAGAAAPALAQGWFDSYRTFSVYVENDALAKWQDDTTDESFTQGMRFTWQFAKWPEWAASTHNALSLLSKLKPSRFERANDECTPQRTRAAAGACGVVSFGLGQTMYAPRDIITSDLQTTDQPFAGWLFATIGLNTRDGKWQSGTEFVVGVIGPASLARDTQSLAHWTWSQGSPKPAGWDHQLKSSVHAGLMQTYAVHAFEFCVKGRTKCSGGSNEGRIVDFSPKAELIATTVMVRASGGALLRAGYRFPDTLGQRIPATASYASTSGRGSWWFAAFAGYDWRAVGHNAFLSGSYADGGANGWRNVGQIEPRRGINEGSAGFTFGNNGFTVSVQGVSRSLEWDPVIAGQPQTNSRGRHNFLSVMFGLNSGS